MTISLMSTLLLVSSKFDKDIKLVKPSSGNWEKLKYDWLKPNLLVLSHSIKKDFKLFNLNMGVIKTNSQNIHENMKYSLENAFSRREYDSTTLLMRTL